MSDKIHAVASFDVLKTLEAASAKKVRSARICALSDDELMRAIELLRDGTVIQKVSCLDALERELRARHLPR
jgi:hypothetical protein